MVYLSTSFKLYDHSFIKNVVIKLSFPPQVSCTFDINKLEHPCSTCMVPTNELANVERMVAYRTESSMKEIYEDLIRLQGRARDVLSKRHSLHPVKVYISS